jgi:hypothetical protein
MPTIPLMKLALWAFCVLIGSVGVFLAIVSFARPAVSGDAIVLLGAALGINHFISS